MTERDDDQAIDSAALAARGKDVDGLVTLPGVHSASGAEKAGTGEVDDEFGSSADDDPHQASETYPRHPTFGGPPTRHS
jgi:hypothetical protein